MSESKYAHLIKKMVRENPEVFEALVEFEKTGKLPRLSYRQRINLTIDVDLLKNFKRYCREHSYNMSRLIEKHMKEELSLKK